MSFQSQRNNLNNRNYNSALSFGSLTRREESLRRRREERRADVAIDEQIQQVSFDFFRVSEHEADDPYESLSNISTVSVDPLNDFILHPLLVEDVVPQILSFAEPQELFVLGMSHKMAFRFIFKTGVGHELLNEAHQPTSMLHPLRRYMWQRRDTATLPLSPLNHHLSVGDCSDSSLSSDGSTTVPAEESGKARCYGKKRSLSKRSTRYTAMLPLFPDDPETPVLLNGNYDGVQIAPTMTSLMTYNEEFLTLRQRNVRAMAAFPGNSAGVVLFLLGTAFGQVLLFSLKKVDATKTTALSDGESLLDGRQNDENTTSSSNSLTTIGHGLEVELVSMVHHGRGEVLSFILLPNKERDRAKEEAFSTARRYAFLPQPVFASIASISADNIIRVYPSILDSQSLETHVVLPYCTGQQQTGRGIGSSTTSIGTAFQNPWWKQETFLAICAQQEVVVLRHTGEHIWQLCGGVLQQYGWSDNPTFWYDKRKNRLMLIVASRRVESSSYMSSLTEQPRSISTIQLWDIPETRNVFNRTEPIAEFSIPSTNSRYREQRGSDQVKKLLVVGNVLLVVTATSLLVFDLCTLTQLGVPKRVHHNPKIGVSDAIYSHERESIVFLLDDDSVREWKPHEYYKP